MMSYRIGGWLLILGLCLLCVAPVNAQGRAPRGAVAASGLFQAMQATGKPALIIAGSTGCIYCVEMSEELSSNPKLQPLVQQMFVVKIDVASRDWPILRDTFKFSESGIPAVFFVRADGELLYSDAGKPNDVEGFLTRQLKQSGELLDDKQLKLLARDARQLELALKRKDLAKAAGLVKEHAGTGSYAAAALAFDNGGAFLVEQATELSKAAVDQLTEPRKQMGAALELLELQTSLASHEPAQKVVAEAIAAARSEETVGPLIMDAEQLQPAQAAEASKQWKTASDAYAAAERNLATEAAKSYAAERIKLLQPRIKK